MKLLTLEDVASWDLAHYKWILLEPKGELFIHGLPKTELYLTPFFSKSAAQKALKEKEPNAYIIELKFIYELLTDVSCRVAYILYEATSNVNIQNSRAFF